MAGAGSAVAQSPASLRAAVLYSAEAQGERPVALRATPTELTRSFLLPPAQTRAPADTTLPDPWLGRDKALHAAGSFLLTLSAQYVLTAKLDTDSDTAVPIAAGAALSLGLAKEVADSRRPVRPLFSTRDLVADAVGVALAVGLILL